MAVRKETEQCYSGIGGQAVLEGVMMKNREMYAVAVRKPDSSIEVDVEEYHGVLENTVWRKIPLVRGVLAFIDSMSVGMKSLDYSSSFYVEGEEPTGLDRFLDRITGGKGEKVISAVTLCISFALAIGLFLVLPLVITDMLSSYVRNSSLTALIEGLVRLAVFLIYMLAIAAMKDIRRLYCYHGAEHKCINCLEHGMQLKVENVRKASRFHKRCGTSFTLLIVVISIVLFFFIRVDSRILRILLRLALVPVIAGISFEILRFTGKSSGIAARILAAPGLLMQRLTVFEPDDQMIEVAIASVEAVFDWREFLRNNFGYTDEELSFDLDEDEEEESQRNYFEELDQ